MEFLNDYTSPVVLGICLCVGYILKQYIKDVDNKYIPTICGLSGVILSVWMSHAFTPKIILSGLISGLGSTGMHQMFKQWLEKT